MARAPGTTAVDTKIGPLQSVNFPSRGEVNKRNINKITLDSELGGVAGKERPLQVRRSRS